MKEEADLSVKSKEIKLFVENKRNTRELSISDLSKQK